MKPAALGSSWRRAGVAAVAIGFFACGPSGAAVPDSRHGAPTGSSQPAVEKPVDAQPATSHDLSIDEAMGGHTLERHVGRSDAELIERLDREPQLSSASTYTDRATAESVVAAALRTRNGAFASWRARSGRRPNFVVRYHANRVIGRTVARGRPKAVPCDRAVIVLRWDERRDRYYVLTSYPEPRR
jgi:hypothetical protein